MAFCSSCGADLPHGARFCPSCASPVAEAPRSEERKLATVVFADLVGSTALADSQDERLPVLGLSLGQPPPPGLHPLAVREHLHAAWLELLRELTAADPPS